MVSRNDWLGEDRLTASCPAQKSTRSNSVSLTSYSSPAPRVNSPCDLAGGGQRTFGLDACEPHIAAALQKLAHRRLPEKNKLSAADAKHIEEAFRNKLLSFAIDHAEGVPEPNNDAQKASSTDGRRRKGKPPPSSPSVDKLS